MSENILVPTTFNWPYKGSHVQLAGNFDPQLVRDIDPQYEPWKPLNMSKDDGSPEFRITLNLQPGKSYSYKFVVDEEWVYDGSRTTHDDGKGNLNNVISVEVPPQPESPLSSEPESPTSNTTSIGEQENGENELETIIEGKGTVVEEEKGTVIEEGKEIIIKEEEKEKETVIKEGEQEKETVVKEDKEIIIKEEKETMIEKENETMTEEISVEEENETMTEEISAEEENETVTKEISAEEKGNETMIETSAEEENETMIEETSAEEENETMTEEISAEEKGNAVEETVGNTKEQQESREITHDTEDTTLATNAKIGEFVENDETSSFHDETVEHVVESFDVSETSHAGESLENVKTDLRIKETIHDDDDHAIESDVIGTDVEKIGHDETAKSLNAETETEIVKIEEPSDNFEPETRVSLENIGTKTEITKTVESSDDVENEIGIIKPEEFEDVEKIGHDETAKSLNAKTETEIVKIEEPSDNFEPETGVANTKMSLENIGTKTEITKTVESLEDVGIIKPEEFEDIEIETEESSGNAKTESEVTKPEVFDNVEIETENTEAGEPSWVVDTWEDETKNQTSQIEHSENLEDELHVEIASSLPVTIEKTEFTHEIIIRETIDQVSHKIQNEETLDAGSNSTTRNIEIRGEQEASDTYTWEDEAKNQISQIEPSENFEDELHVETEATPKIIIEETIDQVSHKIQNEETLDAESNSTTRNIEIRGEQEASDAECTEENESLMFSPPNYKTEELVTGETNDDDERTIVEEMVNEALTMDATNASSIEGVNTFGNNSYIFKGSSITNMPRLDELKPLDKMTTGYDSLENSLYGDLGSSAAACGESFSVKSTFPTTTTVYNVDPLNAERIILDTTEIPSVIKDQKTEEVMQIKPTDISATRKRSKTVLSSGESTKNANSTTQNLSQKPITKQKSKPTKNLDKVSSSREIVTTNKYRSLEVQKRDGQVERNLVYLVTSLITTFTLGIISMLIDSIFGPTKKPSKSSKSSLQTEELSERL